MQEIQSIKSVQIKHKALYGINATSLSLLLSPLTLRVCAIQLLLKVRQDLSYSRDIQRDLNSGIYTRFT